MCSQVLCVAVFPLLFRVVPAPLAFHFFSVFFFTFTFVYPVSFPCDNVLLMCYLCCATSPDLRKYLGGMTEVREAWRGKMGKVGGGGRNVKREGKGGDGGEGRGLVWENETNKRV